MLYVPQHVRVKQKGLMQYPKNTCYTYSAHMASQNLTCITDHAYINHI